MIAGCVHQHRLEAARADHVAQQFQTHCGGKPSAPSTDRLANGDVIGCGTLANAADAQGLTPVQFVGRLSLRYTYANWSRARLFCDAAVYDCVTREGIEAAVMRAQNDAAAETWKSEAARLEAARRADFRGASAMLGDSMRGAPRGLHTRLAASALHRQLDVLRPHGVNNLPMCTRRTGVPPPSPRA